eukprot:TRINITY_DN18241_c0_g1_i1.p1 TRINITY_DN18241_c0_g1~~TRINITY_DN18241_c0_g1_i1.p1  ORF type:complete len:172 (+),score=30.40 TRINITY_DN18241_c0_g1_i1:39-554(+)
MDMFINPPKSLRSGYRFSRIPVFFIRQIFFSYYMVASTLLLFLRFFNLYKPEDERRREECVSALEKASSYAEWKKVAKQLDILEGHEQWKKQKKSAYYDWPLLDHRLKSMKKIESEGDIHSMCLALRAGLLRNLGGMGNPQLFAHSRIGTKKFNRRIYCSSCQATSLHMRI